MFWRSAPQVTVVVVIGAQDAVAPDAVAPAGPSLDPDAVARALEGRVVAAQVYVDALADFQQADAEYRTAFNEALISASGPEYLRKAVAEQEAAEARGGRDVAERARAAAEQAVRLAELGWRSAMAGAAPEAGDQS